MALCETPHMGADESNEEIVRRFCAAFARRDVNELCEFFAPDAVPREEHSATA